MRFPIFACTCDNTRPFLPHLQLAVHTAQPRAGLGAGGVAAHVRPVLHASIHASRLHRRRRHLYWQGHSLGCS